jgi:hypothetical protein
LRLDGASAEDVEENVAQARERLSSRKATEDKATGEQEGLVVYTASTAIKFDARPDTIILCDFGFNSEVDNEVSALLSTP